MAEMLPLVPSGKTRSEAELHLFRRFKEEAPPEWTVLHSLGLRGHARKPWAEADFVLITPRGLLVIEVKGGAVRRQGRRWYTNDKELRESPFDQGAGASAALFNELRTRVPFVRDGIVGSAVAFPDVVFVADGPDLVSELVYDARDRDLPVTAWLDRVWRYWAKRLDDTVDKPRRGLSKETVRRIIEFLAGDFELRPSLRARLGEVERELVRLTAEQSAVMNSLSSNPRMIVTGGAGTGKTWLAIEEILRADASGQSVLFLCHTKALAAWVRRQLERCQRVRAVHFNGLTSELISQAGLWERLTSAPADQLFRVEHPELALEALVEIEDPPAFDVIVVDEAQDILTIPAVALLDGLLRGGLAGGNWRLFLDPRQDVFDATDVASAGELAKAHPTRFRLSLNCRNTAEIAVQTAVLSVRDVDETLPVSGPPVTYLRFSDDRDLRRQIGKTLSDWIAGGVSASDIVVLGMDRLERTVLAGGLPPGVPATLLERDPDGDIAAGSVRFATVAGFKGLESEAVLIIDIGTIHPGGRAADVYVAMSRARSLLAVGVRSDLAAAQADLFREFGARLRSSAL